MFLHGSESLQTLFPSPGVPEHLSRPSSWPTILQDLSQFHQNQHFSPCLHEFHEITIYCNFLLTNLCPWGDFQSYLRARNNCLYIQLPDHCLSKVVMKCFFGWVFNDKKNSWWFNTNLFLLLNFNSGPPSTDSWSCFWFGIVLFFFFFSPRRLQSHPAKRN